MAVLNGWINGYYFSKKSSEILAHLNEKNGIFMSQTIMNGEVAHFFFIDHNHYGTSFEFFLQKMHELVLTQHPEFHGLLYVFDDEDKVHHDTWQVWVIRKRMIEKKIDNFLSPFSEKVAYYGDDNTL